MSASAAPAAAYVFVEGQRVRFAYPDGHGEGIIEGINDPIPGFDRTPYIVQWDNGMRFHYHERDLRALP